MPGVVIVGVSVGRHTPLLNLLAILYPFLQIACPVNDRLIPNLRDLFDSLPVAEPTDVTKVHGDSVADEGSHLRTDYSLKSRCDIGFIMGELIE